MTDPLLSVTDLHTRFSTHEGTVHAVNGVSFEVREGEIVGMVGETGSGKSVTAHSTIRLEAPGEITEGSIRFRGTELTSADERTIRRIRGDGMGMVFQDPEQTLNPTFTVREQIAESLKIHDDPDSPGLLDYLHLPGFSNREDWRDKRQRAIELMGEVGIPHPEERADAYPHQFSGGMRQRAMLAIALSREPALLLADEPTSSLDVTIQAQILDLFAQLNEDEDMAILLITHDLGVVAELCDRVIVVDGGEIMETGTAEQILTDPRHPYTRGLLDCMPQTARRNERLPTIEGEVPDLVGERSGCAFAPRCEHAADQCKSGEIPMVDVGDGQQAKCCRLESIDGDWSHAQTPGKQETDTVKQGGELEVDSSLGRGGDVSDHGGGGSGCGGDTPVVEVRNLSKRFAGSESLVDRLLGGQEYVQAVSDVSLSIGAGETLGLVGESGSGKTTLANVIAGRYPPTSGELLFDGEPVGPASDRSTDLLTDVGFVFQNPTGSLDPRLTLGEAIAEPLTIQGWSAERREARLQALADTVELSEPLLARYPHEVSGGQAQRAALARAIALDPRLVILDEPVSALDVSVQAKILNLLLDLQAKLDLTYLLIAHDLSVVGHMADRIAVMYLGHIMEVAPCEQLFATPTHPYSEALLSAIPSVDPRDTSDERIILEGDVPSPVDPPSGCPFHPRCPAAESKCTSTDPPVERVGSATSRCHFAGDY